MTEKLYKVPYNENHDFQALVLKVEDLLDENPNLTATEIEEITGADYEDVSWALGINGR